MKTYTNEELKEILEKHRKWRFGEEGGERAYLSEANLSEAYLSEANLSGANLREANLSEANLSEANLSGAYLSEANLSGANLSEANLSEAYLRGAYLRGANLRGANLRGANLSGIKEDLFKVLSSAPNEAEGVLQTLIAGNVDGSVYSGECACLVGTIAKLQSCHFEEIPNITPDSNRPIEKWFMGISEGDTPRNNPIAKITAEWIEEWLAERASEIKQGE